MFVRELYDEQGLYLLEERAEGKVEGEFTEYLYMRKGDHSNHNSNATTNITVAFYEGGIPVGGRNIAEFKPETGEWKDIG